MDNNSTNINKNHLSLQLIEWWSTIPPISTNITSHFNSLSDGQQFHLQYQQKSPYIQLIEWWSTIPPISIKITSHLSSLSDGQQFHQYQQEWPLTSTHWVMVNNSTNIKKNHPSHQLIEWWSTIPPISTKITSHLNSLSDGKQFHQYQQKSPLTSTHWVISTIPPISTKITSHFNSLSDGNHFHQYQQKSPFILTHWVMVNNSTNIIKNHLSHQLIEWYQQFQEYQQKSPLTSTRWMMVNNSTNINNKHLLLQLIEWWSTIPPPISTKITLYATHWVMVNNSTNINKNHLSTKFIQWWSTIPPISTKITTRLNSFSDGQQFHQYQQKSYLTSTHWMMVNNFTNINKNHLSHQLIERWSTIPPISTKITSHLNSLSDGQQFHQYQQKSPLTLTHSVIVNNFTNINKNHHSPQLIEWWSSFPPISTKITSQFNSLSDGQQFHQYQEKSPLISTHWVMINNFTNINKNHISP
jgi:hypothetical protein